uniref:Ig-like domain-containing protein n=1 Tax=Kryptolebias marmoratus TaxID=37003 RepID=A0A3Q3AFG5_KRYMA
LHVTILPFYDLFICISECTKDQNFSTKTVDVGEDVTLTCSRRSNKSGSLFWIKLVPGNLPEVLGATYTFNHSIVKETLHFKLNHGPETFVLQIYQIKLSDTAFYYCEEVIDLQKTVLNIKAIVSEFPSVAVRPGDSVTLQCSVLSESDNQMCPDNSSVHWFRAGSTETRPNLIYVRGNGGEKCERSPEAHDLQKCVYNFSWSQISSSDVGTYYCAVVTCGQILFGKGTKLEMEGNLFFFAIYFFVTPEDTLVYSVPNFTKKKSGQRAKRSLNTTEQQSIYSDIWASGNE